MKPSNKHIWNPSLSTQKSRVNRSYDIDKLLVELRSGDVNALAQAITLIESTNSDHMTLARQLIERALPYTGGGFRIAITGAPGVGKSTFLEGMGRHITSLDHKIAVLSIDPSSSMTHGSILGDKTRMTTLANNPRAFIRPTAAGSTLGGIASKTQEAILLCEAAGFDTVFIETVGVGQSETEIVHMSDAFILMIEPGAGDELQGIKRGIMELADLILVTKADVSPTLTNRSLSAYRHAIHILQEKAHGYKVDVWPHDSLSGDYFGTNWDKINSLKNHLESINYIQSNRINQDQHWLDTTLKNHILDQVMHHKKTIQLIAELKTKIQQKEISVPQAVQEILSAIPTLK